jgi:hypothetical protein
VRRVHHFLVDSIDMAAADPPDTQTYRQRVEAVLQALRADPRHGLDEDDARKRLDRDGRNELAAEKRIPPGGSLSRGSGTSSSSCC